MKALWKKIKWWVECAFVMCILFPIIAVMFHFWAKDYEHVDYD